MNIKLPMDALATFEIAARLGSFAKAAGELNLTPSAVSHQLRTLERHLGFELFVRRGRSIRLSPSGKNLLKTVRPAVRSIGAAVIRLSDGDDTRGPITVACSSMFAQRVLSQRLGRFVESYPHIECSVDVLENDAVLLHEAADVGVVFGNGDWSGRWSLRIGSVRYSPACSPELLATATGSSAEPADLMDQVIIHVDDGTEWRRWRAAAGIADDRAPQRQIFTNDVGFALEIAVQGGGVTLSSDIMAAALLKNGLLVRPFAISIDVAGGWYVTVRHDTLQVARVQIFLRWLAQQFDLEAPRFV